MKVLDFRLPPFRRISWTSAQARQRWEPVIQRLTEQVPELPGKLPFPPAVPVTLARVYPYRLEALAARCAALGLELRTLELEPAALDRWFLRWDADDRKITVLVGRRADLEHTLQALEADDFTGFHRSLGTPACCVDFLRGMKRTSLEHPAWAMTQNHPGFRQGEPLQRVPNHYATNPVLASLGLRYLPHWPCRPDCSESLALARRITEAAAGSPVQYLLEQLREVLSWPVSWSTLHGIDEIKTPVFRLVCDAQPSAGRHQVDFTSDAMPEGAARGLSFPFLQPHRLHLSGSRGYRNGMENPLDGE